MSEYQLAQSGTAFACSLLVGLGGMPVAQSLGNRLGMVTQPRLFGRGGSTVSYLGGAALALSVFAVMLPFLLWSEGLIREAGGLLAGAFVLLGLGLIDDKLRDGGLSPWVRLMVQTLVSLAVWSAGVRAAPTGHWWVDGTLTVFFLVAATNAFNLLDNMDGVAGSCAAAIAAGLFFLSALGGQYLVAILAAATVGASLAFLRHNLANPRVYLGNAGSNFLGFLIAATTLKLRLPLAPPWSYLGAVAILAVPVADTSLVILSRLVAGRPCFLGGVDHVSHRLVRLGFSTRGSALAHCGASAAGSAAVAVAVLLERNEPLVLIAVGFLVMITFLFRVRVYEAAPGEESVDPSAGEEVVEIGHLDISRIPQGSVEEKVQQ